MEVDSQVTINKKEKDVNGVTTERCFEIRCPSHSRDQLWISVEMENDDDHCLHSLTISFSKQESIKVANKILRMAEAIEEPQPLTEGLTVTSTPYNFPPSDQGYTLNCS